MVIAPARSEMTTRSAAINPSMGHPTDREKPDRLSGIPIPTNWPFEPGKYRQHVFLFSRYSTETGQSRNLCWISPLFPNFCAATVSDAGTKTVEEVDHEDVPFSRKTAPLDRSSWSWSVGVNAAFWRVGCPPDQMPVFRF
jgi:hypothetical protein